MEQCARGRPEHEHASIVERGLGIEVDHDLATLAHQEAADIVDREQEAVRGGLVRAPSPVGFSQPCCYLTQPDADVGLDVDGAARHLGSSTSDAMCRLYASYRYGGCGAVA